MVTVVTGPPCSGKSTHVATHAKRGDVVIDLDAIASALTVSDGVTHWHTPLVRAVALKAREAAITEALSYAHDDECNVWIVHSKPTWHDRARYGGQGAHIVKLDPGYAECMRRAQGQRPRSTMAVIARWYGIDPNRT